MPKLLVNTKTTYANKAAFDAVVGPVNTFMDNNSGVAEFRPGFNLMLYRLEDYNAKFNCKSNNNIS